MRMPVNRRTECHHNNKESRMRTLQLTSCMAVLLGGLLLVTGCSKSIQANSGSKSFEPGAKRTAAPASLKASTPAGNNQPSPMREPKMSDSAMMPEPGMMSEPATPIPSLSTLDSGPSPLNAKRSDEERVPGEMLVAKTEPSDMSRRQVEEIQREHLATAASGLEDV